MGLRLSYRGFFLTFSSSLQMDAGMYAVALVPIYQTKRRHVSEGSNPHSHPRDYQNPQNLTMFCTCK